MPQPPRRLLTLDEVAEQLGCSVSHVRTLIRSNELRAVDIGSGTGVLRRLKVAEAELVKFLARRAIN